MSEIAGYILLLIDYSLLGCRGGGGEVMHEWGDSNVDWRGISDAAEYIGSNLCRWGRADASWKEKWGTVRVYCTLDGVHQLHSLTHPGYAYSQYPDWLWRLDCGWGSYLVAPLNLVLRRWQRFLYRYLYSRAVARWPHLTREILSCADYPELLRGIES